MSEDAGHYPSLEQRVVFITGGGSGIGAGLTRAFHRQGAWLSLSISMMPPARRWSRS